MNTKHRELGRLRADFISGVSHELKTPVTLIPLYAETLLCDENASVEERADYYQIITRESERLSHLIDKVVDARAGLPVFHGMANCTACHVGSNFTDEGFHNTGVDTGGTAGSLMRGASSSRAKTRTAEPLRPPLCAKSHKQPPFMHEGSLASLEEVIESYNGGGNPNSYRDPELRPLHLTQEEKESLLAFLRALKGSVQEDQ